jgi:hypothetical protein
MSKTKVIDANEVLSDSVEESYKQIISADQEQTKNRAQALTILPEEAKKEIMVASQYSSYFPNPITKDFQRKYILAKLEFPTKGSQLAQSMTELNVRIDNLFQDAYSYKKTELEAEELELEMLDLEDALEAARDDRERKKLQIKIDKLALEQQNKAYSLNKVKLTAMARYNEAMGWKACVEEIMQEMGVSSPDEVDFNSIRMDEMEAKIRKWGELHAQGALELTPSKFQAIDSNQEAFVQGLQGGQAKIEEAKKVLQLADASKRN